MNFLAHIYLSGEDEHVKIGNYMADSVGNKIDDFPSGVKKGILLHRAIDTYTDQHPVFRQGTKRLHPIYHHYAGVIMDMFYDHLLAKNWSKYSDVPLENYAQDFYDILRRNENILAEKTKKQSSYMIQYNWLTEYASLEGIGVILAQMDHRTKHKSGMANSVKELKQYYSEFEQEFFAFFEDMEQFVANKKAELEI
mgnify:CR=1 FL=1